MSTSLDIATCCQVGNRTVSCLEYNDLKMFLFLELRPLGLDHFGPQYPNNKLALTTTSQAYAKYCFNIHTCKIDPSTETKTAVSSIYSTNHSI